MPLVELSEKIDGHGSDPWIVESDTVLITKRAITNWKGDDLVVYQDGVWVRSFFGGRGVTRYRKARVKVNGEGQC